MSSPDPVPITTPSRSTQPFARESLGCSGVFLGCSGDLVGALGRPLGGHYGKVGTPAISGTCPEHVRNMSRTCPEHVRNMSGTCPGIPFPPAAFPPRPALPCPPKEGPPLPISPRRREHNQGREGRGWDPQNMSRGFPRLPVPCITAPENAPSIVLPAGRSTNKKTDPFPKYHELRCKIIGGNGTDGKSSAESGRWREESVSPFPCKRSSGKPCLVNLAPLPVQAFVGEGRYYSRGHLGMTT